VLKKAFGWMPYPRGERITIQRNGHGCAGEEGVLRFGAQEHTTQEIVAFMRKRPSPANINEAQASAVCLTRFS
jgi:hypothetical protein